MIDLNIPVKKEETKRDNYNFDTVPENAYTEDIVSGSNSSPIQVATPTNIQSIAQDTQPLKETQAVSTTKPVSYDELKTPWYYRIKDGYNTEEELFNIDSDGNVIAKLNRKNFKDIVQENGTLVTYDNEKLKAVFENAHEQIRFIDKQKELKEEIKGYPELSAEALQLIDLDKTLLRFRNQKSTLRTILRAGKTNMLRIILSIVSLNKYDEYIEMIDKGIIVRNENGNKTCNFVYDYTLEHKKFPSLQSIFDNLELPYSKEFCKEYLFNEDDIMYWINFCYETKTKENMKILAENIKSNMNSITINDIVTASNKILEKSNPKVINDEYDDLEKYLENKEKEIQLTTGIKALNDEGFQLTKGKICSVFAYTGSFKTMFCTNVAFDILRKCANVVYISLEIDKKDMYFNFLSRYSYYNSTSNQISHSDIKSGNLTKEEKDYLFNELHPDFGECYKKHLIIYDEKDITTNTYEVFNSLLSKAENQFIKTTGNGVDLIIVDHINLLKFGGERIQNDYSAVNHWMSYFRKNAIDFLSKGKQVAILCAAQSSREGFKEATKHKGKYSLTSIAEGNEIERSSSYVLSIYTSDNDRKNNKTQMQILKSRDATHNDDLIEILIDPKYYAFGIDNVVKHNTISNIYSIPNNNNATIFGNRKKII